MESVLQRLGFLVDTSGLMRGQAAMDSAAAAGVRLGAAADLASVRLSSMGRGPATANLRNVSTEMDRAANASRAFNTNAEQVNTRLSLLGTAAGTVAGILAFQLIGAIAGVASELASLPVESARAADALTRFNSQLMFAFRGSSDSVRQARQDIVQLAREAGVSISQLRNDYADIAISGRSAGLTRTQVSGVVGAFAQLGQLSGADPGALSRSMYQYQQMLNIGQVRWSDFKLADLNLPAFGDAAAAGLGVSGSELVGMISRGELSAYRLTEALSEGVPKLIEQAGGQLPELMSRSQAAMETEWTRLVESMGETWRTSKFIQSLQYGIADLIGWAANGGRSETPAQELARLRGEVASGSATPSDMRNMNRGGPDVTGARLAAARARIAELERALAEDEASAERARRDEESQARSARQLNALGIVTNLDPIRAAQAQARADMALVQGALADTAGLTDEQIATLRRGLSLLEGQISRIESAVDRARRQSRETAADLARYGAGGGFDLARSSRGLVEQSINQMRPISMDQAMAIMRGDWLTDAANNNGRTAADLARRQTIVDAAGLGLAGRRRAQLDVREAEFRDRFGRQEDMPADQRMRVDELAAENRRLEALRMAQDDVEALRERERGDRERLDALRSQLQLGIQLGQQGRILLAQAERERDLRLQFPDITEELVRAERERVGENVRLTELLAEQQAQMARLADAAAAAGATIGDVLGASIAEGVARGRIEGEAALDALRRSATRILDDLLQNLTAPLERRITEMASGYLQRRYGDQALEDLADAAQDASASLVGSMTPAVAESAAKIAVNSKAALTEASAKSQSTAAVLAFSKAVITATAALQSMAAQSAGGDIASGIASLFGSGPSSAAKVPIPGFAKGVENFQGGWAIVGEEGAELVRLPRGSSVIPNGKMPGGDVTINIIDQRTGEAAPVETTERRGANGERIIEVMVRDQVKQAVRRGDVDPEMRAQYGSGRVLKKV